MILLTQIHEFANSIIREDLLMANKLNREHKSTLFASMFSDKKNALDFTQERVIESKEREIGRLSRLLEEHGISTQE